ncbi:uncharacterized protein LOC125503437 [Dendroctonus ponderosae]|uniref:uncharacterized protein LOC125503437 n=1 Tax=Dendroctonus ponderosae TaxID=77166 RepID=UPI0020354ED9|nr:uncharacterized protein LOC125503437 [Dendroctonus ponderosae]
MYLYYCCELVEMQVHIMSLHIKEFREQLNLHGGSSSFVENGLKKIIKQHHNLLRCNALMRKHMQTAQIIIYCTMFPCTICITIMLFSNRVSWFLKCGALLVHFYIGVSVYHKGQLSHNLIESMCFQLYDLEWYTWDVSNMKTFLLLITNTPKQLNWGAITQTKAINYESFNEVVKVFYTIYNFIRTCKH